MKKILILAGAGPHLALIKTAKKMGIYTIVCDYLPDSPGKKIADEAWDINIFDVDILVKKCKENNVDGVLSVCIDPAQRPYQEICEKLNLPCFGNKEQVFALTDKNRFKEECVKAGLDIIPQYTLKDIKNNSVVYPLFIKPVDSRGSRGQTICFNKNDVDSAIEFAKKESSNGNIIIERYMQGLQDFSMTYIVSNGIPYLFRTADRHLGCEKDGMNRETTASISPSTFTKKCISHILPKVQQFVSNLKIKNAPLLMQGFIDGDKLYMYDPGLRFPGNEYAPIYERATGINLFQKLIKFALGMDKNIDSRGLYNSCFLSGKRLIQIMYNVAPGKIAEISGIDYLKKIDSVVDIQQRLFVGDIVKKTGDIKQRACEIDTLVENNETSIFNIIDTVNKNILYKNENGEDMHISILNPKKISKFYVEEDK